MITKFSTLLGVSKTTLYRRAKKADLKLARQERSDKGASKILTEEQIRRTGALLAASKKLNKKLPVMDTTTAVEIMQDSGLMPQNVSASTVCRHLRSVKFSRRHIARPAPHRQVVAEYPNQVHLFDISACAMYFLDDKKGLIDRFSDDVGMVLYPNKVKNYKKIKRHLHRYAMVDKASGALFFHYFYASGENAIDTARFFHEAWRKKEDDRFIFHGVPFHLYADRGSMADNHLIKGLMKSLRVEVITHMPGNPRAKGGVETMHRWWETKFETRMNFQRPRSLNELNQFAFDFCIHWNAQREFRDASKSRAEMFASITQDQLRLVPEWEVYQHLMRARPETRKVGSNLIINFYGKDYFLENPNLAEETVQVGFNPYHYPTVEVVTKEGVTYVAEPLPDRDQYGQPVGPHVITFGEFKAHKDTATRKVKKEGFKWLSDVQGTSVKGKGEKERLVAPKPGEEKNALKLFGHQAEKVGNLSFVPKKGKPIEVQKTAPKVLPLTRALLEIAETLGRRISKTENKKLTEKYPAGIPLAEIDEIVKSLETSAFGAEEHAG